MKKRPILVLSTTLLINVSVNSYGQFWKDVGRAVTAPITAPFETTKRIVQGNNVKDAIVGPWQPAGRLIQQGSQVFQTAQNVFTRVEGSVIERTLGSGWRKGYEALTASQRVQFELATTSGRYLGGCLAGQQCTTTQLVAGPLAASLRDAYKVYFNYSYPLPPQIVQVLSTVMPQDVAMSARWAVGSTPNFTVPGFLNFGNEAFGSSGHAVTIGNVMIFSRWPDLSTTSGWNWLLHELRHIEQYKRYNYTEPFEAIDGFCVEYVRNWKNLEQDAETTAQARLVQLPDNTPR